MATGEPKLMDVAEFRELGYLQEVNRCFLHPLGLALSVSVDQQTGEMKLGGIWDYRDDPEGIIFAAPPSDEHASRISSERREKSNLRFQRFGYAVQPTDADEDHWLDP